MKQILALCALLVAMVAIIGWLNNDISGAVLVAAFVSSILVAVGAIASNAARPSYKAKAVIAVMILTWIAGAGVLMHCDDRDFALVQDVRGKVWQEVKAERKPISYAFVEVARAEYNLRFSCSFNQRYWQKQARRDMEVAVSEAKFHAFDQVGYFGTVIPKELQDLVPQDGFHSGLSRYGTTIKFDSK